MNSGFGSWLTFCCVLKDNIRWTKWYPCCRLRFMNVPTSWLSKHPKIKWILISSWRPDRMDEYWRTAPCPNAQVKLDYCCFEFETPNVGNSWLSSPRNVQYLSFDFIRFFSLFAPTLIYLSFVRRILLSRPLFYLKLDLMKTLFVVWALNTEHETKQKRKTVYSPSD